MIESARRNRDRLLGGFPDYQHAPAAPNHVNPLFKGGGWPGSVNNDIGPASVGPLLDHFDALAGIGHFVNVDRVSRAPSARELNSRSGRSNCDRLAGPGGNGHCQGIEPNGSRAQDSNGWLQPDAAEHLQAFEPMHHGAESARGGRSDFAVDLIRNLHRAAVGQDVAIIGKAAAQEGIFLRAPPAVHARIRAQRWLARDRAIKALAAPRICPNDPVAYLERLVGGIADYTLT